VTDTRSDLPARTAARPLVTILVPAYNAEKHLREALESMLAQTYRNVEIILLDDASTDCTPEIAKEYAGRVEYVRIPRNLGIYGGNVNVGIEQARGELIATYHADDVYEPTIVEQHVDYLTRHPEVGAVFGLDTFIDAAGREYGRLTLPPEVRGERPLDYATVLNALLTYKNTFIVGPTSMVRASVHRHVGGYRPERYRIASDLEMWVRIARHYKIAILESYVMKYRHFHGNATQQYFHLRTTPENVFMIVDDYLDDGGRALATPRALVSYEAHRSEDRLMVAVNHYIKGELADGRAALRQARLGPVVRTPQVQRTRLLVLYAGLWVLLRLPRLDAVAKRMFDRWHVKQPPETAS
jgi:glycosyltransferase involved in cell wall biosynthesis